MILDDIFNPKILNIFTDVSVKVLPKNRFRTCYGAVAVTEDNIIDEVFRVNSNSTVNEGEAKGIQTGLYLALKYRNSFDSINIFSDSLITINNLNKGYKSWFSVGDKLRRKDKHNPDVSNASVYLQILDIVVRNNLHVHFYHVKGHIDIKNKKALDQAIYAFIKNNNFVDREWEYNFMIYLCSYNDYVDKKSRMILKRDKNNYVTPFKFVPYEFNNLVSKYIKIKEETNYD